MCFYIFVNACLLSEWYIYSILYPSWVLYGNYHVLINKHLLKRNQHDLKFSLLNTELLSPVTMSLGETISQNKHRPRSQDDDVRFEYSSSFQTTPKSKNDHNKVTKDKAKVIHNKCLCFSYRCGCLLTCEIESIPLLFQAIDFHPFIYSLTNHLLTVYLVNNIIRYANYNKTMNINDTCHQFFFSP